MRDGIRFRDLVTWKHFDKNGNLLNEEVTHNLITNAGFDWLCSIIGSAQAAPATYLAVTANNTAPAATDTTLTSEHTADGLQRAAAAYAHTVGTKVFTMTKTLTASADNKVISKAGLFNASSNGTMVAETLATAAKTLQNGESVEITWTFTLA